MEQPGAGSARNPANLAGLRTRCYATAALAVGSTPPAPWKLQLPELLLVGLPCAAIVAPANHQVVW